MTEVILATVLDDSGRVTYAIHATGHATGSPEVCAAVSALLFALGGWVQNAEPEEVRARTVSLEPGRADLCFLGDSPEARTAFDLTALGLAQIAQQYPAFLRVEHAAGELLPEMAETGMGL